MRLDFGGDMAGFIEQSSFLDEMVANAWEVAEAGGMGGHLALLATAFYEAYLIDDGFDGVGLVTALGQPLGNRALAGHSKRVVDFLSGPCAVLDRSSLLSVQMALAIPLLIGDAEMKAELAEWAARLEAGLLDQAAAEPMGPAGAKPASRL